MQLAIRATLVAMSLAACGEDSPQPDVMAEASAAGTVVNDTSPSVLYRLHATYDGPPVVSSTAEVTFDITRESSTSTATAQVDIWLVVGEDRLTGAAGNLPPESTGQPSLVDLDWLPWCSEPPCDVTADITIDLLAAIGDANPPVTIGTLQATAIVTHETEGTDEPGTVDVTIEQISL